MQDWAAAAYYAMLCEQGSLAQVLQRVGICTADVLGGSYSECFLKSLFICACKEGSAWRELVPGEVMAGVRTLVCALFGAMIAGVASVAWWHRYGLRLLTT